MNPSSILNLTTESNNDSQRLNLTELSTSEILLAINQRDQEVALAVQNAIPQIEAFIQAAVEKMQDGGRLFYIGSGTSGRLGIVDASECPPTFGVSHDRVIGIIAGGDSAIRKATEFAEDHPTQGWEDLLAHTISPKDVVLGISASGRTPYVIGGIKLAQQNNILTGALSCNSPAEASKYADFPIEIVVGPEIIAGSTRLKAGTAQKLTLNMISTTIMIKLGKVKGNKMVDMQLSNEKLIERGTQMIIEETGLPYTEAKTLLIELGSVRKVIEKFN